MADEATRPKQCASPIVVDEENDTVIAWGLTKREEFAKAAMQGLCVGTIGTKSCTTQIAQFAVEQADALIAELAKEPPS